MFISVCCQSLIYRFVESLPESDSLQAYQLGESSGRNGCSFVYCVWRYEGGAAAGIYSIQYNSRFLNLLSSWCSYIFLYFYRRQCSHAFMTAATLLLSYFQALPEAHTSFHLSFHEHLYVRILLYSLFCNFFCISSHLLFVLASIQSKSFFYLPSFISLTSIIYYRSFSIY